MINMNLINDNIKSFIDTFFAERLINYRSKIQIVKVCESTKFDDIIIYYNDPSPAARHIAKNRFDSWANNQKIISFIKGNYYGS